MGSKSMAEIQGHEKGVGLHPEVLRKLVLQANDLRSGDPENGCGVRKSG
jgi:hypothetical protein